MQYMMGEFVGAAIITFLVSRGFLWALKKLSQRHVAIITANAASFLICFVVSAFGHADGGPLNWGPGIVYGFAQVAWLIYDLTMKWTAQNKVHE